VVENDSDTELLQLSYAGIGNAGSKALAAGLVLNNHIHTINIAGNGIGARGAKALGKGNLDIKLDWIASPLHSRHIANPPPNKPPILTVAGLAGNESVVNLVLDNNNLGNEGVCLLLRGLEKNSTLEVGYRFNAAGVVVGGLATITSTASTTSVPRYSFTTVASQPNAQQQMIQHFNRSFGLIIMKSTIQPTQSMRRRGR
jgi:hypothetical protein